MRCAPDPFPGMTKLDITHMAAVLPCVIVGLKHCPEKQPFCGTHVYYKLLLH